MIVCRSSLIVHNLLHILVESGNYLKLIYASDQHQTKISGDILA